MWELGHPVFYNCNKLIIFHDTLDLLQKKSVFLDVSQRIFPWKVCPSPRQWPVFELAATDSHFHSSARGENGGKGQNRQSNSVISDLFLLSGLDHRVSPAFNWPPLTLYEERLSLSHCPCASLVTHIRNNILWEVSSKTWHLGGGGCCWVGQALWFHKLPKLP